MLWFASVFSSDDSAVHQVNIFSSPLNPLRAKFFIGNINIYLYFMLLLHIDMTHALKILPQVRPGPPYFTKSISWLLMSWRR